MAQYQGGVISESPSNENGFLTIHFFAEGEGVSDGIAFD